MKYIIGFALLGLVTYAGLFFLIAGLNYMSKDILPPANFNAFTSPSGFTPGAVEGTITQTVGRADSDVTERDFLGMTFGEDIVEYIYVIPAGRVSDDLSDQQYMAVRVSGEDKKALLDEITFTFPKQPSELSDSPKLEFTGYVSEMDEDVLSAVEAFLVSHEKLIGIDTWDMPNNKYFTDHICRYTVTVRSGENDYDKAIIIGAAVSALGLGGIVLLIVKKIRAGNAY